MSSESSRECAVAVFVKTPEFSPVKTRLATGAGKEAALHFYELSCQAIQSTLISLRKECPFVDPYWAVAEEAGESSERWRAFPCLLQGKGALGERLHSVYSRLIQDYTYVILIGADSPQVSWRDLQSAVSVLREGAGQSSSRVVIGPANDGGFYLFGSDTSFPEQFWTEISYSASFTGEQVRAAALEYGEVITLPVEIDVDTVADLHELALIFPERCDNSPAHSTLSQWLACLRS